MLIKMDITIIHCANEGELFDVLRLGRSTWKRANFGDIVFRGQSNANWHLVPSAFGPNTSLGYREVLRVGPSPDRTEQARGEFYAVREFLKLADQVGLPVPGDSHIFRDSGDPYALFEAWPPLDTLPTLAIAQHHGVPTRLLDVTYDAYTAAFFAVLGPVKAESEQSPDLSIAVWAIDIRVVRLIEGYEASRSVRIQEVTVPRANNPNLHAQHGMFLIDSDASYSQAEGGYVPLEDVICQEADYWQTRPGFWPAGHPQSDFVLPIVKIVIPASFSHAIMMRLHREGKTQAHLTPSYDGVVAALELIRSKTLLA